MPTCCLCTAVAKVLPVVASLDLRALPDALCPRGPPSLPHSFSKRPGAPTGHLAGNGVREPGLTAAAPTPASDPRDQNRSLLPRGAGQEGPVGKAVGGRG